MNHKLSIIVVAYNEAQHIKRLYQSISNLKRPDNVEIESILIDGGSKDNTATIARSTGFAYVFELPGANIPKCRNFGLSHANGDWIAFVDGDCEIAPNWLENAAELLEKTNPLILGWPVHPASPMTWIQVAWHTHWQTKNQAYELMNGKRIIRQEGFRLITTRNMIFHRTIIDTLNGFDEELSTGEDTDFVFRAYMIGITVAGYPDLEVIHHGEPSTLKDFFLQQLWHANRNSYKRILKTYGCKSGGNALLFSFFFLVSSILALVGIALTIIYKHIGFLAAIFPNLLTTVIPAAFITIKSKKYTIFFQLLIIYWIYGMARTLDIIGLHRNKISWKSFRY